MSVNYDEKTSVEYATCTLKSDVTNLVLVGKRSG